MVIHDRSVEKYPRLIQDYQTIACCKKERVSLEGLRRENYQTVGIDFEAIQIHDESNSMWQWTLSSFGLMCTITLREAFRFSEALLDYNTVHCGSEQSKDESGCDDDQEFEMEEEHP